MSEIQFHLPVSLKMFFSSSDLVIIFNKKVRDSVNSSPSSSAWIDSFITYRCNILCHGDLFGLLSGHFRFSPGVFCDGKPFDDFCLCSTAAVPALPSLSWRTEGETSVVPRQRSPEHQRGFGDVSLDARRRRIANAGEALPLCLPGNVK